MSTKGVFILRKDGQEKAMAIRHDAYPGGAGIDIVDLVKKNRFKHAVRLFDDI